MEEKETMNISVPEKPIEPAPKQPAPIMSSPATTMMQPEKKKANVGMLACIVILVLLALGGLGFGVYAMSTKDAAVIQAQANCEKNANNTTTEIMEVTCDDGTTTEVEVTKVIDNYVAQNMINPYLVPLGYFGNMLDYPFDDQTKINVAFNNLNDFYNFDSKNEFVTVSYLDLNKKYQDLFGDTSSLAKSDYSGRSESFVFMPADATTHGVEVFEVTLFQGGGTGHAVVSVVKDAKYENNNVIVDVYHDRLVVCGVNDNEYCVEANAMNLVSTSIEDAGVKKFIEKFADRIPVYKMTFVQNNGHYVLNSLQKQ